MKRKMFLLISVIAVLVLGVLGTASADEFEPNIVDIAASTEGFSTLHTAIVAAGLADTLADADSTFTVFAPTDAAFAALEQAAPGTIASLLADPQGALTQVLLYHVVAGEVGSAEVLASKSLTTLQGGDLAVSLRNGEPYVNDSKIVVTDIKAKNGIIHVIDAVLVPSPVAAPPAQVEEEVMDVAEEAAEEEAAAPAEEAEQPEEMTEATQSIAEIAVANGNFKTLVAALDAAGLVDTFAQPGKYTVFAPTDDAFAALEAANPGITATLLADPQGELTTILLFHVVQDTLTRDQLATTKFVTTMDGRPLTINKDGSTIVDINGAKVIMYNIPATNGIIHVIDTVLIP